MLEGTRQKERVAVLAKRLDYYIMGVGEVADSLGHIVVDRKRILSFLFLEIAILGIFFEVSNTSLLHSGHGLRHRKPFSPVPESSIRDLGLGLRLSPLLLPFSQEIK